MALTLSPSEQRRARLLAVAKRRATGVLVLVAAVFLASTFLVSRDRWLVWVQATAVASLVGGLADWFAVTALFRRPLGLPIPYTAVVVERKDRFAETLGAFVQESFLTPAAVTERLRASQAVERLAAWLSDADHAADLARRLVEGLVAAADLLRDADVHAVLDALVREQVDRIPLAPLAGQALSQVTRAGRHEPLIGAGLRGLSRYLGDHGAEVQQRLGLHSPRWLPGPVEQRMVERLLRRTRRALDEMAADPGHPLRQQLDTGLRKLAEDLQTSDEMRRRGEELKAELLGQPQIRALAVALWRDTKTELRAQSAEPGSELRVRLAAIVAQTGVRLRDNPELAAAAQRSLDTVARTVLGRFEGELAGLVSGTIAKWDAVDTSRRLELLLGPDLQYIRINGTIVGGLAGLILHAITVWAS